MTSCRQFISSCLNTKPHMSGYDPLREVLPYLTTQLDISLPLVGDWRCALLPDHGQWTAIFKCRTEGAGENSRKGMI